MIAAIYPQSEKMGSSVVKEVFLPDSAGGAPMMFKGPYTVRSRIYLNQASKEKI